MYDYFYSGTRLCNVCSTCPNSIQNSPTKSNCSEPISFKLHFNTVVSWKSLPKARAVRRSPRPGSKAPLGKRSADFWAVHSKTRNSSSRHFWRSSTKKCHESNKNQSTFNYKTTRTKDRLKPSAKSGGIITKCATILSSVTIFKGSWFPQSHVKSAKMRLSLLTISGACL